MQRVGGRCRCLHIAAPGQLTAGEQEGHACCLDTAAPTQHSALALAWPPNFIVVISCGTNCGPGSVQCPYFVLVILQCECYPAHQLQCQLRQGDRVRKSRDICEIFVSDSETERTGGSISVDKLLPGGVQVDNCVTVN